MVAILGTLWAWVPVWFAAFTTVPFAVAYGLSLAPLVLLMAWMLRPPRDPGH